MDEPIVVKVDENTLISSKPEQNAAVCSFFCRIELMRCGWRMPYLKSSDLEDFDPHKNVLLKNISPKNGGGMGTRSIFFEY